MSLPFIKASNGNLTVLVGSRSFSVPMDHPNYRTLLDAVKLGDEKKFLRNFDVAQVVARRSNGQIEVLNGGVFYGGKELHGVVVDAILGIMNEGLPFQPALNFLEKVMKNPLIAVHKHLADDLYNFLLNEGLVLTENGNFLSHKVVRNDWMDIYTGTICNKPGVDIPRMEYNMVDSNPSHHCSRGYHTGAHSYVLTYSHSHNDRFLLCEVDPADVVSVPHDGHLKIRVTYYKVLREIPRDEIFQGRLYTNSGDVYQNKADWAEDDWDTEDYPEDNYDLSDSEVFDDDDLPIYTESEVDDLLDENYNMGYEAGKRAALKKKDCACP